MNKEFRISRFEEMGKGVLRKRGGQSIKRITMNPFDGFDKLTVGKLTSTDSVRTGQVEADFLAAEGTGPTVESKREARSCWEMVVFLLEHLRALYIEV